MGLGKRSPFYSTLEDSGNVNQTMLFGVSKLIFGDLWTWSLHLKRDLKFKKFKNTLLGMMMGLGKRSPFHSTLEDSGNVGQIMNFELSKLTFGDL